jgi:hypothetical protein
MYQLARSLSTLCWQEAATVVEMSWIAYYTNISVCSEIVVKS